MTEVRLLAIEIEGFRGFAERRRLGLDAQAIVLRGDNGVGKTSLVDALLWLMTGELSYLVERVRGTRKNRADDAVTNRFNPSGARVMLELRVGAQTVAFTRTGNQYGTELTATQDHSDPHMLLATMFGVGSSAGLRQAVDSWGILGQENIRKALDEAGGALHERLSGVVGLEQVTRFAEATTQTSRELVRERTAARKAHEAIASRRAEAQVRLDAAVRATASDDHVRTSLHSGLARVKDALAPAATLEIVEPLTLEAVAALGKSLSDVLDSLRVVADHQAAVTAHDVGSDDSVATAQKAVEQAEAAASTSAQSAPRRAQLAAAAIELLGEKCPVCEQPIDEASVRAHLQEILDHAGELVARVQQTQDELARARTALAEVRETARLRKDAQAKLDVAQRALAEVLHSAAPALAVDTDTAVDQLLDRMESARADLRSLYVEAREMSGAHIERLEAEVRALQAEVEGAEASVRTLEGRCQQAKALEQAAHAASQRIIERALAALQPSFAEVFDRLLPSSAFTELGVKQDIMHNRNQVVPVVRDPDRGVEANPLLVFSEGQLNVVALSYFLGMALNAGEGALPFLVLDDPLQALDVLAILGLSDLCRRVREHRQLIVTTHDRRFADVLVRKLSPRDPSESLIVHEFAGWTREGPIIETTTPPYAEIIRLVDRQAS